MKKLLGLLAVAPMALAACGGDDAVKTGKDYFEDHIDTKFEVQKSDDGNGGATALLSITDENIKAADKFYTIDHKSGLAVAEFTHNNDTDNDTTDDYKVWVALVEYNNSYGTGFEETLIYQFTKDQGVLNYGFTGDEWASVDENGDDKGSSENAAADAALRGITVIKDLDFAGGTAAKTIEGVENVMDALQKAFDTVTA